MKLPRCMRPNKQQIMIRNSLSFFTMSPGLREVRSLAEAMEILGAPLLEKSVKCTQAQAVPLDG